MIKYILSVSTLASLLTFSLNSAAMPDKGALNQQLGKLMPNATVENISETPIKGLYEVTSGVNVFYTDDNVKYLIYGHLLDVSQSEPVSLTENTQKHLRAKTLHDFDHSTMVSFNAKNPKHEITVFTDIDCGYCRKLHSEVPALNKAGISVHYVAFPRAGVDSPSFEKAEAVWCADNPQEAMNNAKAGQEVKKPQNCNKHDVIVKHMDLVRELDLRATPVIFLEDGSQIPGYVPADRLIARINQNDAGNTTG